jgi:RNA polymerase sigma-70 factor (ECF subfamily)
MQDEFAEVALSYQRQLWNAALRLAHDRAEAEDLFQETYRRAFEHAASLRSLSHCRTWLFRILHALVVDTRRRQRRSPILTVVVNDPEGDAPAALEPRGDFQAEMLDRLSAREIEALVRALPREQRDVLILCDVEGFTYQEIAEILACPIGTVRSRLSRARAALVERLQNHARAIGIGARR